MITLLIINTVIDCLASQLGIGFVITCNYNTIDIMS